MRHCEHTEGEYHSCVQVDRTNRLIADAESAADERLEQALEDNACRLRSVDQIASVWSSYFHEAMNTLTEAKGIRRIVRH